MTRQEIGQKLAFIRKNKGISQRQVEQALNLGLNNLSRIERGTANTSIDILLKIAEYIGAEFHIVDKDSQ